MYSFDIFSMVILADQDDGAAFFRYMQDRLQGEGHRDIPQAVRANFARIRMNAWRMAERFYKRDGKECVNLEDIYQIIAATAVLDAEVLRSLETLECDIMVETAVGLDINIKLAEDLIKSGKEVSFFADTVYCEDVVKKILRKCSPWFEGCRCFCSSETGKTQRTGSLFWKANQITGIKRADWIYYSISPENRKQAKRVGLTPGDPESIKYMGAQEPRSDRDFVFRVMETLYRAAVLECSHDRQRVGSRVGAPLLLQYVEWVLDCADKLGASKLCFVARDGYILKKIADLLIADRQLGIKTQYIYGSRKAWRIPSFSEEHGDITELLRWSHIEKVRTYGDFSDIFGLTVEELAQFLPLQEIQGEMKITRAALAYCIAKLRENQEFRKYLVQKNAPARELLKRYLQQEMGTDKENIVFVELAGGGYTQECLANMLRELGISQITNLYFKIDSADRYSGCRNYTFWPNAMRDSAIIETLSHSPEGQTLGYRECNGKIVPVLEEDEGRALTEYGYEEYVEGVLLFTQKYVRYLKNFLIQGWSIASVDLYMDAVINKPDKELLSFISGMPFGVTGREKKVLEYAPALTESQLVEYYRQGAEAGSDYCGICWEYSLRRTQWESPELVERYKHCEKAVQAETPQDEYPVEFIRGDALLLGEDQFGENVCRMVREKGKRITRLALTADFSRLANTECQIVLAVKEREQLDRLKAELEAFGVQSECILAIDLQPKYILGKQR